MSLSIRRLSKFVKKGGHTMPTERPEAGSALLKDLGLCPMRHSGIAVFAVAYLILVTATGALAAPPYIPPATHARHHEVITIHRDRTHERVVESILRIETALGVSWYAERVLPYKSTRAEIEVLQAETVSPDGTRHPVAADAIRTTEESLPRGSSMFSDTKNKVIVFPNVTVGASLYLKYRLRHHTPSLGDEFFLGKTHWPDDRYEDVRYHVVVHPDVPLFLATPGLQGGEVEPTTSVPVGTPAGYRHHVFTFRQLDALAPESDSVSASDFAPRLLLSTFRDHREEALSYEAHAAPKVRVTPEVQALADEVTRGLFDQAAQVQRLHEWVARNIRYVAIELGDGGLVPNDVAEILTSRYGDCKDHVVLLQSLLQAKGIDSSAVLVNLGDAYRLSPVGGLAPLNHVIAYVPALALYLDPTARFVPFGLLPESVMDKPVVLTRDGRFARTPRTSARENVTRSTVRIAVAADGSMTGSATTLYRGTAEPTARSRHLARQGRTMDRVAHELLGRFNETGMGTISGPDPTDITRPFELRSTFELDPVLNIPGPSTMRLPIGISSGRIASEAFARPPPERRLPWVCAAESLAEEYEIHFARSLRVTRIPPPVHYRAGPLEYQATYELSALPDGQLLRATRRLVTDYPSSVCGKDEDVAWRAFHPVLQRDVRGQVFVE
jgi:transglutaminase-like putative cysteine protease